MFRKSMIALAAIATIGAAALAPTAASAGGGGGKWGGKWGGGWHHKHHFGFYGAPVFAAGIYTGCWVKRLVDTPYGPRLRRVYVCY